MDIFKKTIDQLNKLHVQSIDLLNTLNKVLKNKMNFNKERTNINYQLSLQEKKFSSKEKLVSDIIKDFNSDIFSKPTCPKVFDEAIQTEKQVEENVFESEIQDVRNKTKIHVYGPVTAMLELSDERIVVGSGLDDHDFLGANYYLYVFTFDFQWKTYKEISLCKEDYPFQCFYELPNQRLISFPNYKLWNLTTYELIMNLNIEDTGVSKFISISDTTFTTIADQTVINIWDKENFNKVNSITSKEKYYCILKVEENLVVSRENCLEVYDISSFELQKSIEKIYTTNPDGMVEFSQKVAVSQFENIIIVDIKDGNTQRILDNSNSFIDKSLCGGLYIFEQTLIYYKNGYLLQIKDNYSKTDYYGISYKNLFKANDCFLYVKRNKIGKKYFLLADNKYGILIKEVIMTSQEWKKDS